MSQSIALIVHSIMDAPETWRADPKPNPKFGMIITNGYYSAAMNGSAYGMGVSFYPAQDPDIKILQKAIAEWKQDTGWTPPEEKAEEERPKPPEFDETDRGAYEEFSRSVRAHHKSYAVHGDASVFAMGIQNSLLKLDSKLRPMGKIEGKK